MFLGQGVAQILPMRSPTSGSEHCYPPHYSGPVYERVYRMLQKRAAVLGFQSEERMAS
jgi:hypothetical protein